MYIVDVKKRRLYIVYVCILQSLFTSHYMCTTRNIYFFTCTIMQCTSSLITLSEAHPSKFLGDVMKCRLFYYNNHRIIINQYYVTCNTCSLSFRTHLFLKTFHSVLKCYPLHVLL